MLKDRIQLSGVPLSSRLVMAPVALEKANGGRVAPDTLAHYEARTRGGHIGLVVVEHSYVRADGRASVGQLSVSDDGDVPGLRQLADTIHKNGSRAVMQLSHAGAAIKVGVVSVEGVSPSGVPNPNGKLGQGELQPTHAMTQGEIDDIQDAFVQAAKRAMAAGFDGVELHSAHGYLLNQFYSPLTNRRTDAYTGATLAGRTRLHVQLIGAVRQALGGGALVGMRLGGCDYLPGGSTIEDAAQAAVILEQAGLDFLDLSGGMCFFTLPGRTEPGYFGDMGRAVKQAVHIPVILTGGVKTRADAEALLAGGMADLVGVGRALLKDPDWAGKAMAAD